VPLVCRDSPEVYSRRVKPARSSDVALAPSWCAFTTACEVNPNVLHRWRRELQDYGTNAFAGNGQRRIDESQVAELERKVGRQALEIDFLRRCLQHVEEQRKA
jgi:transposase